MRQVAYQIEITGVPKIAHNLADLSLTAALLLLKYIKASRPTDYALQLDQIPGYIEAWAQKQRLNHTHPIIHHQNH